jgi:hypothetical protein
MLLPREDHGSGKRAIWNCTELLLLTDRKRPSAWWSAIITGH